MDERFPVIGAHVSTAGGLMNGIAKARAIGASAIQIFSSAPQQWKMSSYTSQDLSDFREACIRESIAPVFVHGAYLINLASDNPGLVEASKTSLIADMEFASAIGAMGVIFHTGSNPAKMNGDKRIQIVRALSDILETSPADAMLIVENSAGAGSTIGSDINDLGAMRSDIASPNLAFCIDTAHAFASGYDIRTTETVSGFADLLERTIRFDSVVAIHANDAKVPLGSNRDRHENIGKGTIGMEGFRALLNHEAFRTKPFILETPGVERRGPDAENIGALRRLAGMEAYETRGHAIGRF